jgi:hypothetical protein
MPTAAFDPSTKALTDATAALLTHAIQAAVSGVCSACVVTVQAVVLAATGVPLFAALARRRLQTGPVMVSFSITGGSPASLAAVAAAAASSPAFAAAVTKALGASGRAAWGGIAAVPPSVSATGDFAPLSQEAPLGLLALLLLPLAGAAAWRLWLRKKAVPTSMQLRVVPIWSHAVEISANGVPAPAATGIALAPPGAAPTPAAKQLASDLAGVGVGDELALRDSRWGSELLVFEGKVDCTEESSEPNAVPRYLAISRSRLLVFAPGGRLGAGVCVESHHLKEVAKVVFSRRVPGRVVVHVRLGGGIGSSRAPQTLLPRSFVLNDAAMFISALQERVSALQQKEGAAAPAEMPSEVPTVMGAAPDVMV